MADTIWGLPLALLVPPGWPWLAEAGGSRTWGGPYPLGCEVMAGRGCGLLTVDW
jgi:hypothetical protein